MPHFLKYFNTTSILKTNNKFTLRAISNDLCAIPSADERVFSLYSLFICEHFGIFHISASNDLHALRSFNCGFYRIFVFFVRFATNINSVLLQSSKNKNYLCFSYVICVKKIYVWLHRKELRKKYIFKLPAMYSFLRWTWC